MQNAGYIVDMRVNEIGLSKQLKTIFVNDCVED